MKIALLERQSLGEQADLSPLKQLGEVQTYATTSAEELPNRLHDIDIAVSNKISIDAAGLAKANRLKLICLSATGTDSVDLSATQAKGIAVANITNYSTDAVAQQTMALALGLLTNLVGFDRFVKTGGYTDNYSGDYYQNTIHEIAGHQWGIIGMGHIGQKVAQLATAFGAQVSYFSPTGNTTHNNYQAKSLEQLLTTSDIVSVHTKYSKLTADLLAKPQFELMKPTAMLLNVSRGRVINENDLAWALNTGQIAAAGLDVTRHEPMHADDALLQIQDSRKLIITPHIGWASVEARQRAVDEIGLNIAAFQRGEQRNIVL